MFYMGIPAAPPESRSATWLAIAIESKLEYHNDELETYQGGEGAIFESLPLSTDVTLRREVFADGSHGPVDVTYQTGDTWGYTKWYDRLEVVDGDVYYHVRNDRKSGLRISGIRRGVLLAKVLKGKPDHWDREDDFFGTSEEIVTE